jgi:hypothetical protein
MEEPDEEVPERRRRLRALHARERVADVRLDDDASRSDLVLPERVLDCRGDAHACGEGGDEQGDGKGRAIAHGGRS